MTAPGSSRGVLDDVGTPLAYAAAAVVLGVALPRLEAAFLPELSAGIGAGQATAVLSAIASGTLPLTGLVFSLAFVIVQFSSTAYSPRLVSWLVGSRLLRHSVGIFTATFLYSLAALAWIDRGGTGRVPLITVWFAIALLLGSVVAFLLLVQRLSALQISRVLAYAGDQGRAVIERDYGPLDGATKGGGSEDVPKETQVVGYRGGPAVVQGVEVRRLLALAEGEDVVVSLACAVGDTVMDGMPLLRVHGGRARIDEPRLRSLVKLGPERTFEQDPKYAIRLLVDIAIKALSPAINDPTTAVQALDQIEDLLLRLGRSDLDAGHVRDARGRLRFVLPVPSWDDLLVLAFDEIRYCGASSIQLMRRMRALLQDLQQQLPPERRPALQDHLGRVDKGIRRAFEDQDDRRDALDADRQGLGLSSEQRAE